MAAGLIKFKAPPVFFGKSGLKQKCEFWHLP
jgi:hypothetical protein